MSMRERDRLRVMQALSAGRMRQAQAARELGVSVRQVKRLLRGFRGRGAAALVDARRGCPSNRRLPASTCARAIELVAEHYRDFGPTLAREYLAEHHGVALSVESLRQLMIGAGLWGSRAERRALHPPRERRPCFGALGIEHIAALRPQAKGRVERTYRTLQDRLVKALRLASIDSLQAANTFLPGFVQSHNARFASPAADPRNAHRPSMLKACELEDLLCLHYERKVDRNLIAQFERTLYQIQAPNRKHRLAGRKITVLKHADQAIRLRLDNRDLAYRILKNRPKLDPPRDRKTLELVAALATPIAPKPRPDHPWKKWQPSAKTTTGSRLNPS